MAYTPATDFPALLRATANGLRMERMPGLDYAVLALGRTGLISVWVGQTPPTANQVTTVWLQPAIPSWSAEGQVFLWNSATGSYQAANPLLWADLIAGPFISSIPLPGTANPIVDGVAAPGTSLLYARQDHVHPTDTSRAPINSPVLTGTPQAPTPTLGDNTTNIATTAFVIANGGLPPPIGSVIAYAGNTAPASQWALCQGQAVSRTTFATLFALLGITFGAGDGVTTFNIPDLRGRVIAGVDAGANRLTTATMSSQALAGIGGAELVTLLTANLPPYTPSGAVSTTINEGGSYPSLLAILSGGNTTNLGGASSGGTAISLHSLLSATSSFSGNAQGGSSTGVNKVQPTMELQYLMRLA